MSQELEVGQVEAAFQKQIEATLERLLAPLLAKLEEKMTMPAQEWFSIKQTAALTGLSQDHIRRHIASGLLPAINQGTFDKPLYRIHRKDIDEWMAKRREAPQPAPRKRKKKAEPGPGSYVSRHHNPKAAA